MTATLDFVVIGAQRGGSTQLSAYLRSHPSVFLPADEIPYFEDPFYLHSSAEVMDAVLAGAGRGARRGIHCPSYLARTEVAPRLHEYAPGATIVVVLRDPVARAVSAYYWYVQFGMLPLLPADVGLAQLLDGWSDPAFPQAWEVLDWSDYGRHLAPYVELFGRDRVVVVPSDRLADPRDDAFCRLYGALGIDPEHDASGARRANEGVYDLRRLRFLRLRSGLAWSWSETSTFSHRGRRLRHPLRFLPNAAIVGFDRLILSRLFDGAGSPALPPALEARLRARYADDVVALGSLLDLDLGRWRTASVEELGGRSPRS